MDFCRGSAGAPSPGWLKGPLCSQRKVNSKQDTFLNAGDTSPSWLCRRFCRPLRNPGSITGPSAQAQTSSRPGLQPPSPLGTPPPRCHDVPPGSGGACVGTHSSHTATRPLSGSAPRPPTGLYCSIATAPGQRGGGPTAPGRSRGRRAGRSVPLRPQELLSRPRLAPAVCTAQEPLWVKPRRDRLSPDRPTSLL